MTEVLAVKVPKIVDDNLYNMLTKCISPEKRERIKKFKREDDRLRGLFAELLIRSILMKKTGLPNEEISFGSNQYGKPFLEGREDIHFNLSHSGIWVVAAVDSQPVGIDVEKVESIDLSISDNFFSEDEHHDLMEQPDKLSYFFTLWTLKESYIKNIGKGLSLPLDSFSIRFVTRDRIVVFEEGKVMDKYCFVRYNLHSDYKMVLCAYHDRLPRDVTVQSADMLIKKFI